MLSAAARKSRLPAANKKSKATRAAADGATAAVESSFLVEASFLAGFGRGAVSTAATRNLTPGGGLPLGTDAAGRTLGRGSRSTAAAAGCPISASLSNNMAVSPSSIGRSGGGAFPGAIVAPSALNNGFPFPPSPSTVWWDSTSVDPISPTLVRSTAWDPSWIDLRSPLKIGTAVLGILCTLKMENFSIFLLKEPAPC